MAKSEIGVRSRQCTDRRIPDRQTLTDEVSAWQSQRNENHTKANWQFTNEKARVKLRQLYPAL